MMSCSVYTSFIAMVPATKWKTINRTFKEFFLINFINNNEHWVYKAYRCWKEIEGEKSQQQQHRWMKWGKRQKFQSVYKECCESTMTETWKRRNKAAAAATTIMNFFLCHSFKLLHDPELYKTALIVYKHIQYMNIICVCIDC